MEIEIKRLERGSFGPISEQLGHEERQKWSFTEDLYKELRDSIIK